MNLLLAQLPNATPAQLGEWLIAAAGAAGLVLLAIKIWKELRPLPATSTVVSPQPFEVRAAAQYQHVSICRELHAQVQTAQKELADMFDTQLGRERGGRKELHGDITGIKAELAALRAETQGLSASLDEVKEDNRDTRARIDLIPQRLVDMLRSTKDLI